MKHAAIAAVALTVIFGLAYPLAMTGAARVLGAEPTRLAQDYPDDLFQARPSVTGYAADATFFNNQGPNQKALAEQLAGFRDEYLARERPYTPGLRDVPVDAATTSASGVDPHISLANAEIQANRVAARHGLSRDEVLAAIKRHTSRQSVNVVDLNEELR